MRLYHCDQKIVLRFHNEGAAFMKQYSTNVLKAPRNAFVDTKGRIVAVFDQYKVNDDEMWAVTERSAVKRLMAHLFKYLYITDTKVDPVETIQVYWDLDNEAEGEKGDIFIPQRAGRLWLTPAILKTDVSEAEMRKFRVVNEIPWQGIDFEDEMVLCVDEELVSHLKGCYLGQEIVARVHYKGQVPKRIIVKNYRDCTPEQKRSLTSKVVLPSSGEEAGFVFEKTGPEA